MGRQISPSLSLALFTGFSFVVFLLWFSSLGDFAVYNIFQERDLVRAQAVLSGSAPFYGPEMSGGMNLPGPFYYFLLAIPLALGAGVNGSWWLLALFYAAAGAAVVYWLKRESGVRAALFFAFGFCFCFLPLKAALQFWNASLVLPLYLFYFLFRNRKSLKPSGFFVGLVLGLVGQIHFTLFVFFVDQQIAHHHRREHKAAVASYVGFFVSLMPFAYFYWKRGLDLLWSAPVMGGVLNLFSGGDPFGGSLVSRWANNFSSEGGAFVELALVVCLAFAVRSSREFLRKNGPFLTLAAIPAVAFVVSLEAPRYASGLFGILLVIAARDVSRNSRKMLIGLLGVFILGILLPLWRSHAMEWLPWAVAGGVVLAGMANVILRGPWVVVACALLAISSSVARYYSFSDSLLLGSARLNLAQLKFAAQKLGEFSGLPYSQLAERTLFLNVNLNHGLRALYAGGNQEGSDEGYLVFRFGGASKFTRPDQSPAAILPLLLHPASKLEGSFRSLVAEGKIEVSKVAFDGNSLFVAAYKSARDQSIRGNFQNQGLKSFYGRELVESDDPYGKNQSGCEQSLKVSFCENCGEKSELKLCYSRKLGNLTLVLGGWPISLPDTYMQPRLSLRIRQPRIEYLCGTDWRVVPIGSEVGSSISVGSWRPEATLLAPLMREIPLACGVGLVSQIKFAYSRASAYSYLWNGVREFGPFSASLAADGAPSQLGYKAQARASSKFRGELKITPKLEREFGAELKGKNILYWLGRLADPARDPSRVEEIFSWRQEFSGKFPHQFSLSLPLAARRKLGEVLAGSTLYFGITICKEGQKCGASSPSLGSKGFFPMESSLTGGDVDLGEFFITRNYWDDDRPCPAGKPVTAEIVATPTFVKRFAGRNFRLALFNRAGPFVAKDQAEAEKYVRENVVASELFQLNSGTRKISLPLVKDSSHGAFLVTCNSKNTEECLGRMYLLTNSYGPNYEQEIIRLTGENFSLPRCGDSLKLFAHDHPLPPRKLPFEPRWRKLLDGSAPEELIDGIDY